MSAQVQLALRPRETVKSLEVRREHIAGDYFLYDAGDESAYGLSELREKLAAKYPGCKIKFTYCW